MKMKYKKPIIFTITIVVIVVLFLLAIALILRIDSPAAQSVRSVLPVPAAMIGWSRIPVSDIDARVNAVRFFYENPEQEFARDGVRIDFTTDDGRKRESVIRREVLNKAIEDLAVKKIAAAQDIVVTNDEIRKAVELLKNDDSAVEDESIEERVNKYGWSLTNFTTHVMVPELYRQKVENAFYKNNPATPEINDKIALAQAKLTSGAVFEDVAREYSEGITAELGGSLGLFTKDQLNPILSNVAFTLETGVVSDIVDTPTGLHILRVDEIITDPASGEETRKISHIVVNKKTFAEYLDEEIKAMDVRVFLPGFVWDQEAGFALFKDASLRAFEEKQLQAAQEAQATAIE